jgi:hypothetical protein
MSRRSSSFIPAALVALWALPLAAQQAKLPPVRTLPAVTARSSEPLSAVATAVPLPGGKVLVNDILQRRVVMLDSMLVKVAIVADSTGATANAYGARGAGLIGYGGDSALFIDPASLSMMVINAAGELTTVRAVPRANEIGFLVGGPNGRPGFDPNGRLYYRGQARGRQQAAGARGARGGGGGGGVGGPGGMTFAMPEQPDSAPIVRVDLATRKLDTVATFKIPKVDIKVTQGVDGRMNIQTSMNPLPMTDDWALLSDGTIAVVRGHDFHVDWIAPDGQVTSSPKLPYEWQRLSDDDKQMVVDSARAAIEKQREEAQRMMDGAGGPQAFIAAGGAERVMVMGGGGAAPPQRGAAAGVAGGNAQRGGGQRAGGQGGGQGGGPGGGPGGGFRIPNVNLIPANELPDYRPPFGQQSALGDLDGNLWVRTTAPSQNGGALYYVITRSNEIIDRVELPQGRILAGFGKGGLIYLGFRDAEQKAFLEVTRWK